MTHHSFVRCDPRAALFAALVVALSVAAACSSTPARDSSDWAKSYAYPLDDVWLAAEDAADSAGFKVEDADRDLGRLRIASGITVIEMHFEAGPELVRVDAYVANAGQPGLANMQRAGERVESILNEISRVLRERAP